MTRRSGEGEGDSVEDAVESAHNRRKVANEYACAVGSALMDRGGGGSGSGYRVMCCAGDVW